MKNLVKFFIIMTVFCITACTQTFENTSNEVQKKAQGRLVMKVGNESRTIKPTIGESDVKTAVLTANNKEIKRWSGDNIISQIENTEDILLDVGNYDFTMTFRKAGNIDILTATISQEIVAGDNNILDFDMKPVTTGTGDISITLTWDVASGINKITAGLYYIATNEQLVGFGDRELTITTSNDQIPTALYSLSGVSVGQYIIKFKIYAGETAGKHLNTLSEVINVAAGITTSSQITLSKINTQYSITYNPNGGAWKDFIPTYNRNANKKITLPTANDITREGYEFAGWYDGNGNVITEISSDTTEDITVTAVWRTMKETGTVEWNTTANTVAAVIETLSGEGSHNIIVTGEISDTTISDIKGALQSNSSAKVNLDLSGTTGLTSIGNNAFQNCSSLTSVTIPDNVTSVKTGAFKCCSSLTSVAIGDKVESIGDAAFYDCKNLTTVNYKGTEDEWKGISIGNNNNNLTNAAINYNTITVTASKVSDAISNLTKGGSYTIIVTGAIEETTISAIKDALLINSKAMVNLDLSGTTGSISIGGSAFLGRTGLTSVTIGNEVEAIGDSAFYGCTGLTSVEIPDSVTTIGGSAFQDCTGLTSVTIGNKVEAIGDNVTEIGDWAFYNCSNLTSVTIGNKVTSIGDSAFYECNKLATVNYKGTEEQWNGIRIGSDNSNLEEAARNYYSFKVTASEVSDTISNLTEGGSYTIIVTGVITSNTISAIKGALQNNNKAMVNLDLSHIENLIELPDYAFNDCSSLESVTIGNNVTKIGGTAFFGCTGLTSVTIGDKVESIGDSAFYGCTGLTSVEIPDSVTTIGGSAFQGCSSLTSVTIGNKVETIGGCAFGACSNLTTVNYKGTEEEWGKIEIDTTNYELTSATKTYNYTGE